MILIRKGTQTLKVSMGAYNDTFKKIGYEIVDEKSKEEVVKSTSSDENKNNLESQLLKEEEQENETKTDNNEDVVSSEQLLSSVGDKVEDDFGFEDKTEPKTEEEVSPLAGKEYQKKLEALRNESKPKSGK